MRKALPNVNRLLTLKEVSQNILATARDVAKKQCPEQLENPDSEQCRKILEMAVLCLFSGGTIGKQTEGERKRNAGLST